MCQLSDVLLVIVVSTESFFVTRGSTGADQYNSVRMPAFISSGTSRSRSPKNSSGLTQKMSSALPRRSTSQVYPRLSGMILSGCLLSTQRPSASTLHTELTSP